MFFTILYHHFPPYLLFISIQQKERLKWLWGIHLKPIKALIFNHNIQLLGKSRETFRKFTQIRLETLETSCIFPQFSLKYIMGSRFSRSKPFPECIKASNSRQFWRTRYSNSQMLKFLAWNRLFSLFLPVSFSFFTFLMFF